MSSVSLAPPCQCFSLYCSLCPHTTDPQLTVKSNFSGLFPLPTVGCLFQFIVTPSTSSPANTI